MFRRVAGHLAGGGDNDPNNITFWAERFFNTMSRLDFLPNSPTLMNAGRVPALSLSACFVLPVEDSMQSIFAAVSNAALVHQAGGGTGFSFSQLRPEGDVVGSTGGVASGPVSFMQVFDSATETVRQGGTRRGANMGVMCVDHPDIMKFIRAKGNGKSFSNFNFSVALTDAFMQAVEAGASYDLINPRNGERWGSLNAREVFDEIAELAWAIGDPGVIFIDKINASNPTPKLGNIDSTNPCVTGDTPILTDLGYIPIGPLVGQQVTIWNGFEWSSVIIEETGQNQPIVEVELNDGVVLKCTPYHKWITNKRGRIEAKDLNPKDGLAKCRFPVIKGTEDADVDMYTQGFFAGDGSAESNRDRHSIWLYGEKKALLPYLSFEHSNECDRDRIFLKLWPSHLPYGKTWIPGPSLVVDARLRWLAGLIDSDGTVNSGTIYNVSVWSVDKGFLLRVKLMLNTLGVSGAVYPGKPQGAKNMPDGKGGTKAYQTQTSYRLILGLGTMQRLRMMGMKLHRVKEAFGLPVTDKYGTRVNEVRDGGVADKVYCFTESKRHSGVMSGAYVAQCGEQPLLAYESCNLGSINLSHYVMNEGRCPEIDWERLYETVDVAVRLLDNVIDVNTYPLDEIRDMTMQTRKIGLGVMGFADMLLRLEIPYNSEKAVELGASLMKGIDARALEASRDIAGQRGAFPACADSIYAKVYPIRNATRTTIAPTGTLSIIAGCSSGIEPLFALSFKRRIMDDDEFLEVNPIFEQVAKDQGFHSDELMAKIAEVGSVAGMDEVPEDVQRIFVTAHDIEYRWHLAMQAAFQTNTNNAVSKTINLRHDCTVEDVQRIYRESWGMGCKGVTIYRDGSKENQVLSFGGREESEVPRSVQGFEPRVRPRETQGFTRCVNTGCGHLYVTVNHDVVGMCEIFSSLGLSGGCGMAQLEAITRLVSLALRSRVSPAAVAKSLSGIRCPNQGWDEGIPVLSCPDALSKAMESDIEEKVAKHLLITGVCPDCRNTLYHEEGCNVCKQCGYSKCG